jgi:hypothetical protein
METSAALIFYRELVARPRSMNRRVVDSLAPVRKAAGAVQLQHL